MVLWRRQCRGQEGTLGGSQEAKSRVIWVKVVAEAMTLVGVYLFFFNLENCGKIFLTNFYYFNHFC